MNFFPLCTASVWPTISGITVERRDQVLITFFSPPRFITSIFSRSGTSTKGPFFSDLLISVTSYQLPALASQQPAGSRKLEAGGGTLFLPPLDNEAIRALRVARLVALGRDAPRRH